MKTILTAVLAGFLFMGATCSTTDLQALVEKVQQTAVQVCGFVPTVSTIIDIFNQNNQQLQDAVAIANAICAAVSPGPTPVPPTGTGATVAGVPIKGYRVRQ